MTACRPTPARRPAPPPSPPNSPPPASPCPAPSLSGTSAAANPAAPATPTRPSCTAPTGNGPARPPARPSPGSSPTSDSTTTGNGSTTTASSAPSSPNWKPSPWPSPTPARTPPTPHGQNHPKPRNPAHNIVDERHLTRGRPPTSASPPQVTAKCERLTQVTASVRLSLTPMTTAGDNITGPLGGQTASQTRDRALNAGRLHHLLCRSPASL